MVTRRQRPQQMRGILLNQLGDGPPSERSIGHAVRMIGAVTEDPCLTDRVVVWQWGLEDIAQPPSTPKAILIDRFESQWIKRRVAHDLWAAPMAPKLGRYTLRQRRC